jgi:hypothetical protein
MPGTGHGSFYATYRINTVIATPISRVTIQATAHWRSGKICLKMANNGSNGRQEDRAKP